jgi:hypothetical protein
MCEKRNAHKGGRTYKSFRKKKKRTHLIRIDNDEPGTSFVAKKYLFDFLNSRYLFTPFSISG